MLFAWLLFGGLLVGSVLKLMEKTFKESEKEMNIEEYFKLHAPQTYQAWLMYKKEHLSCPPCHGDCNQGRDCPAPKTIKITWSNNDN